MKQKKVFITGIAGFAGMYLARTLLEHGYEVHGSIYKGDSKEHISLLKKNTNLVRLDITNRNLTKEIMKTVKPDYIFHLAAFSSVGRSFANERLVYKINFDGTLNMLEASTGLKHLEKFVFISTSEVYGLFKPSNKTLTEADPVNPVSPYGISKAAAEQVCMMYFREYGVPVVISRSFNHSGPGQSEFFVIPSFCKKIAKLEKSRKEAVMPVGNLAVKRDLSDVRDIVEGYRLMAEKGKAGEKYQLCSGSAVSIQTVLKKLLKYTDKKIKIKKDKKLFRPSDLPLIRGDYSRAKKDLGFSLRYNLDTTLEDTLIYWRQKI